MNSKACDCSLIIPTRNRGEILAATLARIAALPDRGIETIVCDNGSTDDTRGLAAKFPSVRWIHLGENHGTAARNIGAVAANGWLLLMLDDDSWPAPGVISRLVQLFRLRLDLGAASLRVRLVDPPGRHDAGGVAGIFFNCGGAVRRSAFLHAGGFPIDYDYYVEEYDLCCRLWRSGWRVEPQGDLLVWHRRTSANRDNNNMLRLLVRNNFALWSRYAPESIRNELLSQTIQRYQRVAVIENATKGFEEGLEQGRAILAAANKKSHQMNMRQFEQMMGIDRARRTIAEWADKHRIKKTSVWSRGKACESLIDLILSANIRVEAVHDQIVDAKSWRGAPLRAPDAFHPEDVDGLIVGTLSCGVAEDLHDTLSSRYPGLPILAPVVYSDAPAVPVAVPA